MLSARRERFVFGLAGFTGGTANRYSRVLRCARPDDALIDLAYSDAFGAYPRRLRRADQNRIATTADGLFRETYFTPGRPCAHRRGAVRALNTSRQSAIAGNTIRSRNAVALPLASI